MFRLLALFPVCLMATEVIPVTSPALYFSPYNTDSNGDGPVQENNIRAGSGSATWIYAGSYLKASFTGAYAVLRINFSAMKGAMPKFRWTVDGLPMQTAQPAPGTTELSLASGLSAGTHTLVVYLAATDANFDRWERPDQAVTINGLQLADGSTVSPYPYLSKKRAIFYGDSITEGAWVLGNSNRVVDKKYVDWVAHSDATQAWPRYLAVAMDYEYGAIGSGGMGWLRKSHSGIPPLTESWRFHYAGRPRRFEPAPDLVLVNMGTNDGKRDTAGPVETWLREVHMALPPPTRLTVIIPFNQANRASLLTAVAKVASARIRTVDLGPRWADGINFYGKSSLVSYDGLHPNSEANGQFAALLAAAISGNY